jgi:hypothetical protein
VTTCESNVELTRELFANSMKAVRSIVCLENVSELPFDSSRADQKTVDGVERNVTAEFVGS